MICRVYREGDLTFLNPRIDILSEPQFVNEMTARQSESFTIDLDGLPVAIFGSFKLHEAVWQVWMIATEKVRGKGLVFFRLVKQTLDVMGKLHRVKRFNAQVDASIPENIKFCELLGFVEEYRQVNAGPNAKGDVIGMVYWLEGDRDG